MRSYNLSFCLILLSFLCSIAAHAQLNTQTVRGVVTDKVSEKPLAGVTVQVMIAGSGGSGGIAAVTDDAGRYTLTGVPVGRREFSYGSTGYQPVIIPEVLVTSGKEVVLDIALEQHFTELHAAVVTAPLIRKGAATNEFSAGSARSFNIDEVTRYAGGRNDPSKLVSNYAGAVANSDARNDIVVRGNSPAGVLWRIQGSPSPNPNHFSTLGTTGGPISALNTNALKTSDFLTGAWPAEYGNATSAVFDISLRSGNSSKCEQDFQLDVFSGLEVMVEGPLNNKNNGAAYLAGYRYSFAQIAQSVGINIGTKAVPRYQDWVFNITTGKGRLGKFSFFGMGGISHINLIGSQLDTTDFYAQTDQDAYDKSNFSYFGIQHTLDLGSRSYLRTVVSYAHTLTDYEQYQYPDPVPPYKNRWLEVQSRSTTSSVRWSSYFNEKINSRLSYRIGFTGEDLGLKSQVLDKTGQPPSAPFDTTTNINGTPFLLQYFAQFRYRVTSKLAVTGGVHGMRYSLNGSNGLEPRLSVSYQLPANQSITLSYGLHSQLQPEPVYFKTFDELTRVRDGGNHDLGFTKAHHFVIGYEKRFLPDWRVKLEGYYQWLFDVPVEKSSSGFSMLNAGGDFTFPEQVGLVNRGTGYNKGLELTVEKFFSRGYYVLGTLSLFDSKYKGSDGLLRNTAFNYKYVFNLLAGKEWKLGRKGDALTFDTRLSTIGGRYTTPVDLAASTRAGYEIMDTLHYNSLRLDSYFRLDMKFGFRINSGKRKRSQTFYLDLQNITDRKNIFLLQYNNARAAVVPVYQIRFFPDVLYRIQL
jgi:Carboxypeptidase regulatory-like domain